MKKILAALGAISIICLGAVVFGDSTSPAGEEPASAGRVTVVELPLGEKEVVGAGDFSGHALRLSTAGAVLHWTDPAGNVQVSSPGPDTPALEVLDVSGKVIPLAGKDNRPEVRTVSAGQVNVVLPGPGGVRLVCRVEPDRLGLSVEGPGPSYVLRGRSLCRAEGCRVVSTNATLFPSAAQGKTEGRQQFLADARRTRALAFTLPAGVSLLWQLYQTDGWSSVREHLSWQASLRPGQTVWLSATEPPAQRGPVQVGLCRRRLFRPSDAPAAVATLSADRLGAGSAVTLTLSRPPEQVVKGGVLLAALVPTAPDDPVEAAEQGTWFTRFDEYGPRMLPVDLRPGPDGWQLRLVGDPPPGVYRLRLWLAPKDAPRPEALGGPKGTVVGYFPGFEGRGNATHQDSPMGDVLITVAPLEAGALAVVHPAQRTGFWRGEPIHLDLQARSTAREVEARIIVRHVASGTVVASTRATWPVHGGFGVGSVVLDSTALAPGVYEVEPVAPGLHAYPYRFTMAPPPASGLPVANSPLSGPHDLIAYERLGVNLWVDVMPSSGGLTPAWPAPATTALGRYAADPSLPRVPPAEPGVYDELARDGWLFLQGVQSRQISFGLHHSIAEHVEETLRKHLVYAQLGRRFPGTLGLIFDYDLAGTGPGLGYTPPYVKAGERRVAILKRRWEEAWAEAKKHGATEAEKGRYATLFHADAIAEMYRRSVAGLHAAVPGQRHSSAVTADHAYLHDGQYLPAVYRPLDFRYLEVWNDQIYANGAHEMQASFWSSLLRLEKQAGQPLWVTVPTAPQPGTHLRRSLDALARGATGLGYNGEGAAGLAGGWGSDPTRPDVRSTQEAWTGELARKYGTWLNAFAPAEEVAILYSASQGGTNYGLSSPVFFAYYTLAQLSRPARLLTEDEVAAGALKSVKALLLVQQKAPLPEATRKAIEAFAAGGGMVLCDRDTTVRPAGTRRLADVGWPGGLWPDGCNVYHEILQSFARKMGPALRAALGDAGRQPLESPDGTARLATKQAGGATLVFVTNNQEYPFADLFTPDERLSSFYRTFQRRGDVYFKDVRVPRAITLRLRPDLARRPPHVYDVFAGRELRFQPEGDGLAVRVDLATLSGRVLLLGVEPLAAPSIHLAQRRETDPLATVVVKSPVPLPVRIRVGGQEVYRAATPQGSCDTFAIGPAAGPAELEVADLATGRAWHARLPHAQPTQTTLRETPAVQVWDVPRLREVLRAKGLAVYVDARQASQLAAARRLAQKLGEKVEVVFNPPVRDYPVAWDPSLDQEAANEKTRGEGLLAWRRPAEPYLQWTGALAPAALWERPVVLFGHAHNNRLIDDLNQVTLLARPALPDALGPGRAFVQPVAAPFWHGKDAVVVLCADEAGMQAAFAELEKIAAGEQPRAAFALADDGGARAKRRRLLGFEPAVYPADLRRLETVAVVAPGPVLSPSLPVSGLAPVEGGLLVTLHSPGRNFVLLGPDGTTTWRTATAGFYQPTALYANEAGESVTTDGTFVWRHAAGGKVRWKMPGEPAGPPEADGSAWVRDEQTMLLVNPAGAVTRTLQLMGPLLALSPDGRTAFVQRPGDRTAGREKADTALVALDTASGKERWVVPNLQAAELRVSADGSVAACIEHENMAGRDDLDRPDASRLSAVDAATGKVLLRRSIGPSLTDLRVSRDGKRLLAAGAGFKDTLYVADLPAGTVRRVQMPERGAWVRALAPDGKQAWAAGERLYRVDLDTLAVSAAPVRGLVSLVPRPGGLIAGTAGGSVLWLDPAGKVERTADLAAGIEARDFSALLAAFREAPLVGGPSLRPHEVPSAFPLGPEYPLNYMVQGEAVVPRGDGILPPQVAVRIPAKGRYRFEIELGNPKEHADKMGVFLVQPEHGPAGKTAPLNRDRWRQAGELDLEQGTQLFTLMPNGWSEAPVMRRLRVERVKGP